MPYQKTSWTDGSTPLSAANMDNLETQHDQALADVEAQSGNVLTSVGIAGMTGATAGGRFAGFIAGGPPTTGTFAVNDVVFDTTNRVVWICTAVGTPGTWVDFNFLRTDSAAPNPQTVANEVTFNANLATDGTLTASSNQFVVNSAGDIIQRGTTSAPTQVVNGLLEYWNGTGWQVVAAVKSVQRGTYNPGNVTSASTAIAIGSVDTSKAVAFVSSQGYGISTSVGAAAIFEITLDSATQITLAFTDGGFATTVDAVAAWQVVEYY